MDFKPDHGEASYVGSGKLNGKAALITGGDSGIGRAVALAFAREGADVMIVYLDEDDDAEETQRLIKDAGRRAISLSGDLADRDFCTKVIDLAVEAFGRIDLLVNNAAFQMTHDTLEEVSDDEWDRTYDVNVGAIFRLIRRALPHMKKGSSIINTASVNADKPNPSLIAYASTKGAIQNLSGGLAQLLAERGIRVNCVAPGPIWTPLIPSTMTREQIEQFGQQTPIKRAGQPAELAAAYVLLASEGGSYISGATIAVTGGTPFI